MYTKIFQTRLKEIRKEKNLTLQQLGESINMKKNTLSEIENGKAFISFDAAIRVADYFNVSIDYLIGRSDDPTRH